MENSTFINGLTGSLATTFDCSICCETQTDHYVSIQGESVCKDCFTTGVKPQFEAAFKDESRYPVRWGNAELNILDFIVLFNRDFLVMFVEKEREYEVLPGDRIYCAGARNGAEGDAGNAKQPGGRCATFLGSRFARAGERSCNVCKAKTCSCCGSLIEGTLAGHECSDRTGADADEETFKDLKRGKDYQKCPGCGGVVQLQDGCNHLVCSIAACRKHFCYICGEEAYDGTGHWNAGRPCPRYNQPGSEHAFFEQPGVFNGGDMGMLGAPGMFGGVPALGAMPDPALLERPPGLRGDFNDPGAAFNALLPIHPARRDAITILRNRSETDILPDAIRPEDPPEVRLRKLDRQELERIMSELEAIKNAARGAPERPGHVPAPPWIDPVVDLSHFLASLVEVYSIHLETNEFIREIVDATQGALNQDIALLVDEAGAQAFERFPTLRRIVDAYQLALRGEIEELRRQTRD